jgi:hypothetical protein
MPRVAWYAGDWYPGPEVVGALELEDHGALASGRALDHLGVVVHRQQLDRHDVAHRSAAAMYSSSRAVSLIVQLTTK